MLTLGRLGRKLAPPSSEFTLARWPAPSLLAIDFVLGADRISLTRSTGISGVRVVYTLVFISGVLFLGCMNLLKGKFPSSGVRD